MYLIIAIVIPAIYGLSSYKLEVIESNAGLFYQNLGPAYIHNDHVSLFTYRNLTHYEDQLSQITEIYNKSQLICSSKYRYIPLSTYCSNSLNIISNEIPRLQRKYDTIRQLTGQSRIKDTTNRKTRGLLDALGTGLKWLIGTPDANDAEHYASSINYFHNKHKKTFMLMSQQVTIMRSAIDGYNKSVMELRQNVNILNNNIHEIEQIQNKLNERLNNFEATTIAIKHVTLLIQLIEHLSTEFESLINGVLFAKQNILHPSIISPDDLYKELMQMKLHSNLQLPIPLNSDDVHLYFNMIEISVGFDGNVLVYFLRIPTPYKEKYTLYHMIPLPSPHPENPEIMSFILPQEPYLLINQGLDQFSLLPNLDTCKKLSTAYICKTFPKTKPFSNVTCEVQLMTTQLKQLPSDCNTMSIKADIRAWQKINTNSWLYSFSSSTNATISCKASDNVDTISFNGTGIFHLEAGCQVSTENVIQQTYISSTYNYTHFLPIVDIRTDMRSVAKEEALAQQLGNLQSITWKDSNLDALGQAKRELDALEQNVQDELNHTYTTKISYAIPSIITLIVIAGILICLCWKCC